MAQRISPVIFGADVSKPTIDIARYDSHATETIDNTPKAILAWLKRQPVPGCLAVEATGSYHIKLVELAHAHGVEVYLVNPFQLSHYRKSVGVRSKTDPCDARLLARYLAHERSSLRRWQPPPDGYREVWALLHRRAKVVQAQDMLRQSFADQHAVKATLKATLKRLQALQQATERQIVKQLEAAGWKPMWQRCQTICGIGPISAVALVTAYHRGAFSSADAFVAFLGLDIRQRQSGRWVGKAKLTKQGDPECRRVLHNAARSAAQHDLKPYYERLLERGLASTQAHVAVARKLVRVAFSLMKTGQTYDPSRGQMA